MRVLGMRIRAAWRQRTRALVTFALLVALAGAVVLTALAGARRTDSATTRFMRADGTPDLIVGMGALGTFRGVDDILDQPGIDRAGVAALMAALPYTKTASSYMPLIAPTDDTFATTVWRGIVVTGRRSDPRASDEIVLSEAHARLLGAHVGDRLPLLAFDEQQAQACLRGDAPAPGCEKQMTTPTLNVRVVGIARSAIDVAGRVHDVSFSTLSRGFFEAHRNEIAWNPVVMVKLGVGATTQTFVDHARNSLSSTDAEMTPIDTSGMVGAVNVLTTGLLLFALVAAVAAAFAIGQTVVRHVATETNDRVALGALGATRIDRAFDAAGPLGLAAGAGALLAVGGAYLASTFMPIGIARRAEPARGLNADVPVLALGAILLVAFVIVTALVSAYALARPRLLRRERAGAARVANAPVAPSTAIGLRNAFGGSRDQVPVRAALGAIAAATAGVVAVLVFAAGLHYLVHTPALYGWGWDAMDIQYSESNRAQLLADPDVTAVARLERRSQVTVAGHPTYLLAITPVRGSIQPTLVRGRLPQSADEVALGRQTLKTAHAHLGDSVLIRGDKHSRNMRVVGQAAFATSEDGDPLADGVVATPAGKTILNGRFLSDDQSSGQRNYAVRFRAGVDRERALATLERIVPSNNEGQSAFTVPAPPAEVEKLKQVESLPIVLAVFLAVLGILAIAHASFVGVRRRAHDFAILRALGFQARDVRRSISVEALTLAACGALIGIPLGILLGRFAWQHVAIGAGVHVTQRIPALALLLAVPAAALIALAAALIPARRAARLHPGEMLRTE